MQSNHDIKWDITKYFFCFCLSVLCAFGITRLIRIETITDDVLREAIREYPLEISMLQPEAHEFLRYVVFWIAFAGIFFCLSCCIHERKYVYRIGIFAACGTLLFLVIGGGYSLFALDEGFYYKMSFFNKPFIAMSIIAFFWFLFYFRSTFIKKALNIVCETCSILLILISGFVCFIPNPFFGVNLFHVSCYFTSIYNVYYGGTIGLEAMPKYGAYGYLFYPIMKLIGFSFRNYSIIIMLISVIIIICWYWIIRQLISNPLIRLMMLSLILYLQIYFSIDAHGEQFITQYFPHRIFFPTLVIAFIMWRDQRKHQSKCLLLIGYLLCMIAIFSNVESGLYCLLIWGSVVVIEIIQQKNHIMSKILIQIVLAGMTVFGAFASLILIGYCRSGKILEISNFFSTQTVFAHIGYGMLPLPQNFHLYIIVFSLYALFLSYAIGTVFFNKNVLDLNGKWVLALSAIGILLLIQFIGRSHNRTLIPWLFPLLILCGWFAEKGLNALVRINNTKHKLLLGLWPVFTLSVMSVFAVSIIYVWNYSNKFIDYRAKQTDNCIEENIHNKVAVLDRYTVDGHVNYIGDYASVICTFANKQNTYLGEIPTDLYEWSEYDYIISWLKYLEGESFILDNHAEEKIMKYKYNEFYDFLQETGYQIVESNECGNVYAVK